MKNKITKHLIKLSILLTYQATCDGEQNDEIIRSSDEITAEYELNRAKYEVKTATGGSFDQITTLLKEDFSSLDAIKNYFKVALGLKIADSDVYYTESGQLKIKTEAIINAIKDKYNLPYYMADYIDRVGKSTIDESNSIDADHKNIISCLKKLIQFLERKHNRMRVDTPILSDQDNSEIEIVVKDLVQAITVFFHKVSEKGRIIKKNMDAQIIDINCNPVESVLSEIKPASEYNKNQYWASSYIISKLISNFNLTMHDVIACGAIWDKIQSRDDFERDYINSNTTPAYMDASGNMVPAVPPSAYTINNEYKSYVYQQLNTLLPDFTNTVEEPCGIPDDKLYSVNWWPTISAALKIKIKFLLEKAQEAARKIKQRPLIYDKPSSRQLFDPIKITNLLNKKWASVENDIDSKKGGNYISSMFNDLIKLS